MGGGTGQVVLRTTEEEDMAYFEKRYQARVSRETLCMHLLCSNVKVNCIEMHHKEERHPVYP